MDKKYKKLVAILNENNLTRVLFEEEGKKYEVERSSTAIATPVATAVNQPEINVQTSQNSKTITSPILGTFYSSSAPGKKPFVKVGDKVKKEQVLFIIEAMKVMNEVKATESGTITAILPKDGELVEFDATVMTLE